MGETEELNVDDIIDVERSSEKDEAKDDSKLPSLTLVI